MNRTYQGQSNRYDPLTDSNYMSADMLFYFKNKLRKMQQAILNKETAISLSLVDNPNKEPDHVDQGTREELLYNDFMLQEHEDHALKEIEHALDRIAKGSYGYCELTGEAIGVKRLEANPAARFCINPQKPVEK